MERHQLLELVRRRLAVASLAQASGFKRAARYVFAGALVVWEYAPKVLGLGELEAGAGAE